MDWLIYQGITLTLGVYEEGVIQNECEEIASSFSSEIMRRKIGWAKEWMRLSELNECGLTLEDEMRKYNVLLVNVVKAGSMRIMNDLIYRARDSRGYYSLTSCNM